MKNKYFVSGNVAVIEVYSKNVQRYFYTLIDKDDLPLVIENAYSLSVAVNRYTNYITYLSTDRRTKGCLHRLILNTPRGKVVDHKNHNGLDNRKRNIINCTQRDNILNRRKKSPENRNPYSLMLDEILDARRYALPRMIEAEKKNKSAS